MVLLLRCPRCGWTPDRDAPEPLCLICGHSLVVKPQASAKPKTEQAYPFVGHVRVLKTA
jgi:DNA-directed RNA polymerase subunit RPC12/RpoP